ncbi:MAG: hypothetical protein IPF92_14525 [Myxococcales bacterium]|jgi:hypothetical protein|nr:hypothetical protein [Myxococcales bacterium]MBL0195092.1 hypothetical protein [Myxococcales bacterium]HQY63223.1 hypothetical protein [Polyangiaceae bacterium]
MRVLASALASAAALVVTVGACSSAPTATPPAVEGFAVCDNLDESSCIFPFPSDHFRKPGGPYGHTHQLDFGDRLPVSEQTDAMLDREPFRVHDGFPVYPQIAFHIEGASLTGAPSIDGIQASLERSSKTLVIDAETLELQPHWAELDYLAEDAGKQVIELRLARGLAHGKRYVVAVRGLPGGAASRGFQALRDGKPSPVAGVDERKERFDREVFAVTDKLGVPRSELQLAWDFTTSSDDNSTLTLRTMRDTLYERVGEEGPEYSVTEVKRDPDGPTGVIETIVTGVAKVPSFVLPLRPNDVARKLRLGANGLPVAEGFEDVTFRVQIPRVSRTSPDRASVVQYGHGFLGSDSEANNGWLRTFASERNFLILSSDMQGMNTPSGLLWFLHLPKDITNLAYIGDEPLQGIINHLALVRLLKGRFSRDVNVQRGDGGGALYDPKAIYYHGNSQGGTQGALVMAMSRDLERGTLGVPGVSVAWILARANQWRELAGSIGRNYPNPYDLSAIMSLVAVGWDRGDGSNFAKYISATPPKDGTPKNVLLHVGVEDAQVNNDVSRVLGRMVGAKVLAPATSDIWGLPVVQGPLRGENVYVEQDYGVPKRPKTNRPSAPETDTHAFPRKSRAMQEQSYVFFRTGEARHTCDGRCDPE